MLKEGYAVSLRPAFAPLFSGERLYMTDDLKAATQFETQMDALHCRNQLASAWRCCAQVRAVEVAPPVDEQYKLVSPLQI